ncbi:hypothetical protein SS50377_28049 [Spironucleus salmonicida]|uniref:Uncharacterized protein n=2 Tax=Spironucleus salmonicida TaxID=348837 RepID=A0A9P8LKM3_9EUKA|nr:hypothetical protein SS50377_28049 [Spironucleus salmonicida]
MIYSQSKSILIQKEELYQYNQHTKTLALYSVSKQKLRLKLYNDDGDKIHEQSVPYVQISNRFNFAYVPQQNYEFLSYQINDNTIVVYKNPQFKLKIMHSRLLTYQIIVDFFWIEQNILCVVYQDCIYVYTILFSDKEITTPQIFNKEKINYNGIYTTYTYSQKSIGIVLQNELLLICLKTFKTQIINIFTISNILLWDQPTSIKSSGLTIDENSDLKFTIAAKQLNIFNSTIIILCSKTQLHLYSQQHKKFVQTYPLPLHDKFQVSIDSGILSLYSQSLLMQFNLVTKYGGIPQFSPVLTKITPCNIVNNIIANDNCISIIKFDVKSLLNVLPQPNSINNINYILLFMQYRQYQYKNLVDSQFTSYLNDQQSSIFQLFKNLLQFTIELQLYKLDKNISVFPDFSSRANLFEVQNIIQDPETYKIKIMHNIFQFSRCYYINTDDLIHTINAIKQEGLRKMAIISLLQSVIELGLIPNQSLFSLLDIFSVQELTFLVKIFTPSTPIMLALLQFKDVGKVNIGKRIQKDFSSIE